MAIYIHPNRGGDESCGGGGGGGGMRWQLLDMDDGDCSKAWGFFPFHIYKPPKNLLKLTSSELPLDPEPVLILLVRLGEVEEVVEEEEDMRAARSSYLAWDSRGSWPKRPKAHGAAVEVGNREKEDDEDDIYDSAAVVWCSVRLAGRLVCVWRGVHSSRKNASLARGTPSLVCVCLYLRPRTLDGAATLMLGLQQIRKELCSISGIVPLADTITWPGALYCMRCG